MQLPWRPQIVEGLLGADLVGFQRPLAAQNFLQLCPAPARRDADAHGDPRPTAASSRPARSRSRSTSPRSSDGGAARRRARRAGDPREALGRPRTDHPRRRPARLHEGHRAPPEGVPRAARRAASRRRRDGDGAGRHAEPERVEHYQPAAGARSSARSGRINGEFGRVGMPAVHYLHQSTAHELAALYAAADVMMVTPLRDGMNLVPRSTWRARRPGGGALVLSEFAGAAGELRQALLCNPHDLDGLKETLAARRHARPDAEASRRMREHAPPAAHPRRRGWARSFLDRARGRTPIVNAELASTRTGARSSRRSRRPRARGRTCSSPATTTARSRRSWRTRQRGARFRRRWPPSGRWRRCRDHVAVDLRTGAARPRRAVPAAQRGPPGRQPRLGVRRRLRRAPGARGARAAHPCTRAATRSRGRGRGAAGGEAGQRRAAHRAGPGPDVGAVTAAVARPGELAGCTHRGQAGRSSSR